MSDTPTDALLKSAEDSMLAAQGLIDGVLTGVERTIQNIYHEQDLAHTRLRQAAIAEQRIANLIAVASSDQFGSGTRERAKRAALVGLGFTS